MRINITQSIRLTIQLFTLMFVVSLASCTNGSDIIDDVLNDDDDLQYLIGTIVVHQTGGFAGVSNKTTIEAKQGTQAAQITIEERSNQTLESEVSLKDLGELWQTLEENDVFTLPSNEAMLETVSDGFSYEISVERGEKRNLFSVYASEILASETGEKRYSEIVVAINTLANSTKFLVAELSINNITVELMESFPVQVAIVVDGFLRDGCTTLHEINQHRDGNTTHVTITTRRPREAICIQVIEEVQQRIKLQGPLQPLDGFAPGDYTVIVNGVKKQFRI